MVDTRTSFLKVIIKVISSYKCPIISHKMHSIWYFEGKPFKNKKQLYNCGNSTAPLRHMLGTASFFPKKTADWSSHIQTS